MMLRSPDNSRSALAGFDPDEKIVFIFMFGRVMKIATLNIKYTNENQLEIAKNAMNLYLPEWLNSVDNKECNESKTKAAADEVIKHFLDTMIDFHPNWEVWAEKYEKKTDKMVRV